MDCQVRCTTEEEGIPLVSLLKRWNIQELCLHGQVGGKTWEGLARELASGGQEEMGRNQTPFPPSGPSKILGRVYTDREVLRMGRREDLRGVWEKTLYNTWWEGSWNWVGAGWCSWSKGGLSRGVSR